MFLVRARPDPPLYCIRVRFFGGWDYEMIDLKTDAINLMKNLDMGFMGGMAYDTSWVARIPRNRTTDKPLFPQTLLWLYLNQKEDGSWGSNLEYYHDRVLSTLSSIITLSKTHGKERFNDNIKKGEAFIWYNIKNVKDGEHETVAFELLFPSLMAEAEDLGLNLPYHEKLYIKEREKKLILGYGDLLSKRPSTISYSLEHLGDNFRFDQTADIQLVNGSIGNSPAATAFILSKGYDQWAYNYLQKVLKFNYDSAMGLYPFEIFEIAWILDNFIFADIQIKNVLKNNLNYLKEHWTDLGISMSRTYPSIDLDDTAVVFKLLSKNNTKPKPEVFIDYFADDHFKCYQSERNPSMVVQIRVLDAVKALNNFEYRDEYVEKIITYLKNNRAGDWYWKDKWNISEYYTTNLVIRALTDIEPEFTGKIIDWYLGSQNQNGSWGVNGGTHEETAYAIQSLIHYHSNVEKIDSEAIKKGANYLIENYSDDNYPELWIGKGLYAPKNIIKSAIISALHMYNEQIQPISASA